MPDILPPQLADVQQRPFYVKVRSVLTVVSTVWLILAIAGYGFFSGGTTSLALSLTLMYGTGMALLVVASALYRLLKRSAVHRTETAPDDAAAAVFLDATRSATEEIMEALLPSRQPGRTVSVLRARPAAASADGAETGSADAPAKAGDRAHGSSAGRMTTTPAGEGGAAKAPAASANPRSAGQAKAAQQPSAKTARQAANAAGTAQAASASADPAKPTAMKSAVNKKAAAKKKKGKGKKAPVSPSSASTAAPSGSQSAKGGDPAPRNSSQAPGLRKAA